MLNITLHFDTFLCLDNLLTHFAVAVTTVTYLRVDFYNTLTHSSTPLFIITDIPWCYNNPSVCGNTGCDGIQCVCEEDKIYHGPSDCRGLFKNAEAIQI